MLSNLSIHNLLNFIEKDFENLWDSVAKTPYMKTSLYQKNFWSHGLSIMVSGAGTNGDIVEYTTVDEGKLNLKNFLSGSNGDSAA